MSSPSPAGALPWRTRLAYGAPSFGLALVGIPILIYLPRFYSDVVGIPVLWIGVAFVLGRVLDALTDPLVGFLSDRSRARAGRRRPWMAWGCIPLALLSVAVYVPPRLTEGAAMAFAGCVIAGWFFAYTAVNVPYRALGPELTDDYDARTGLFSIREGLLVVGTVFAAVGPGAIGWVLGIEDGEDERRRFAWYIGLTAPVLVLTCLLCVTQVRERFDRAREDATAPVPPLQQVQQAFANEPFVILLSAFVVIAIGGSLPSVLISYFVHYVLHVQHLLPVFLLVYFGVGLACMPAWVALSRRKGKKTAWLGAMVVNAVFFAFVVFVHEGDVWLYGCLVGASGIGGVAVLALPYAMQADVIDHDELATGQRREGLYGGLWSIAEKLAAGVGLGAAMLVLDRAGYRPNQAQPEEVIDTLRVLYIGVPVFFTVAGFWIARRYPIDREAHREIAARLGRE